MAIETHQETTIWFLDGSPDCNKISYHHRGDCVATQLTTVLQGLLSIEQLL